MTQSFFANSAWSCKTAWWVAAALSLGCLSGSALAHTDQPSHATNAEHDVHNLPHSASHNAEHANAFGAAGDPANITRSVPIEMNDHMRFVPATMRVKRGETIRFVVNNAGKLKHEMVLGSIDELQKHAALMAKFPQMEHADPNQLAVAPGQRGELIWHFSKAGKVAFGCLQPGHFEAGMRGTVQVK